MSPHDAGVEKLKEFIDDAIDDYLSLNDAESCCKKLENTLTNGFHYEKLIINLHPQHHLSLNAYTALASAYKVRSIDQNPLRALKMNRFSAAYSFLLAILTHNHFLFEPSLIACVAKFWIGAGESILNLAKSLDLNSSFKCRNCRLIDMFQGNLENGSDYTYKGYTYNEFLDCVMDITRNVRFLGWGNSYLEVVKDRMDLRWFENVNNGSNLEGYEGQERFDIFRLGVHCLIYGGILSDIGCGQDSYLSCSVRRILYGGL